MPNATFMDRMRILIQWAKENPGKATAVTLLSLMMEPAMGLTLKTLRGQSLKDKSDKLNKIIETYDKRDVTVIDGKKGGETMTYILEGKKFDLVIPTDLKSGDSFEAYFPKEEGTKRND